MRQVFLNDRLVPENQAQISVFDRGFVFADAVYEVTAVLDGRLIDFRGHLARLRRSLGELDLTLPMTDAALLEAHRAVVAANAVEQGLVYLQVSRGVSDRDFRFPDPPPSPTVVLFTQQKNFLDDPLVARGLHVTVHEDLRWQRSDIKTTQLLYACMVKSRAARAGADDAWMQRDGLITEAASANAWIVTADGVVRTRQLSREILAGITREAVLSVAEARGLHVEEGAFSLDDALHAKEAFMTSATGFVSPVVRIDGAAIGDGRPGPVTMALRERYLTLMRETAI